VDWLGLHEVELKGSRSPHATTTSPPFPDVHLQPTMTINILHSTLLDWLLVSLCKTISPVFSIMLERARRSLALLLFLFFFPRHLM